MVRTADPTCMKQCVPSRHQSSDSTDTARGARWILVGVSVLVFAYGLCHLPPGVCFGDAGDLQTACATLGIAHPPGYIGCAAVGWVWCKLLFFLEPAYAVSLGCLACMVIAVALLMQTLLRTGLHVAAAATLGVLLLTYRYAWASLTVPEVYAPALAGIAGACVLLLRYGRSHRLRDLLLSAAVLGFTVANRPSLVLMAPGFVLAWVTIEWRQPAPRVHLVRRVALTLGCAALPLIGTVALVTLRDAPGNRYNYLEHYNELHGELPARDEGLAARLERAWWLVSSVQYQEHLSKTMGQVRTQARYVRRELHLYESARFWPVVVVLALGVGVLTRQAPQAAWLALGVLGGSVAFLLLYQQRGQTADLLPLLWAGLWLTGAALSPFFSQPGKQSAQWRRGLGWAAWPTLLLVVTWTVYSGATRYSYAEQENASAMLRDYQLQELPPHSAVLVDWNGSRPLWYQQVVCGVRPDVRIVSGHGPVEEELLSTLRDRPVFATAGRRPPAGWTSQAGPGLFQQFVPVPQPTRQP